jgi:hypothetical protein
MKTLLLFLFLPLVILAEVRIEHLIIAPKDKDKSELSVFSAGKGTATINFETGDVKLDGCTVQEAAAAFKEMVLRKYDIKFPGSDLKVEKIYFGRIVGSTVKGIVLTLDTGAVNWPGVTGISEESRSMWDATVQAIRDAKEIKLELK